MGDVTGGFQGVAVKQVRFQGFPTFFGCLDLYQMIASQPPRLFVVPISQEAQLTSLEAEVVKSLLDSAEVYGASPFAGPIAFFGTQPAAVLRLAPRK